MKEHLRAVAVVTYLICLFTFTLARIMNINLLYESDRIILIIVSAVGSLVFHLSLLNTENLLLKRIAYIIVPFVAIITMNIMIYLVSVSMIPVLIEDEFGKRMLKGIFMALYSVITLAGVVMVILYPALYLKSRLDHVNEKVSFPDEAIGYVLRYYEKDYVVEGVPLTETTVIILERVVLKRLTYPLKTLYDSSKLNPIRIEWSRDYVKVNNKAYDFDEIRMSLKPR